MTTISLTRLDSDRGLLELARSIWSEEMAILMLDHTRVWLARPVDGEVLLLTGEDGAALGITGWYTVPDHPDIVGLRWHGVLPEWRGSGIATAALGLLAERLSNLDRPPALMFETPMSSKAARYFQGIGFTLADPALEGTLLAIAEMPDGATVLTASLAMLRTYVPSRAMWSEQRL